MIRCISADVPTTPTHTYLCFVLIVSRIREGARFGRRLGRGLLSSWSKNEVSERKTETRSRGDCG